VINIMSPLPLIDSALHIAGYTQPGATRNTQASGNNGQICIVLRQGNGSSAISGPVIASSADPDTSLQGEGMGLPNLLAPLVLDVTVTPWPLSPTVPSRASASEPGSQAPRVDAIVCINMLHIAPWAAALALFAGAARHLAPGAPLVTYGPYRFAGALPAPSNVEFDRSLRARDPAWGIRDVVDLAAAAAAQGLVHTETVALPANNHVLVFRR